MDKGIKSSYGISITQTNFIVQDVVRFAKIRGKEFKEWRNKKHSGTGKEKGTIISNMFSIPIKKNDNSYRNKEDRKNIWK